MRSEPVSSSDVLVENEPEQDVVEQELGVDLSPSGLLSRINQNK